MVLAVEGYSTCPRVADVEGLIGLLIEIHVVAYKVVDTDLDPKGLSPIGLLGCCVKFGP